VLIIDDSSYNQFVMKEIMNGIFPEERGRYNIDTALNGLEAIEEYLLKKENITSDKKSSKYDIIFLDLNMPIMDGYQVLITFQ
jgi:CheY-like chemotaxis protein